MQASENMSKIRVLVVEDEAVTASDLHDELISLGYEVAGVVHTAEDALRQAEQTKPDIVLMDINLSGAIDGILAASAMRGLEIPVIFLTAHFDQQTIDRAKKTTPVGYIAKPFESRDLAIAIEIGIERHRSERERTRLLLELEQERAKVKTLSGLLPICACCKKIRDDAGHWNSIESYIVARSEAVFSHTYCPECGDKAMAEITRTVSKH